MTKSKEVRDQYFGYDYRLTDEPDWGYEIHIAKTSGGWLPSFEAHDCFNSIKDLKKMYDTGKFIIYDEYAAIFELCTLKRHMKLILLVPMEEVQTSD